MAFAVDKAKVPLNGMEYKASLLSEERKTYFTEMYYIAVMDCDDEIESILGSSRARLNVKVTMTGNN